MHCLRVLAPLLLLVVSVWQTSCSTEPTNEDVRRYSGTGVATTCDGCPRLSLDHGQAELVVSGEQQFVFSGAVDSRGDVHGFWRVYDGQHSTVGNVEILGGSFEELVPLYCGENLLEAYFSSNDGVTIWRQIVVAEDCSGMPTQGCDM